MNPRTYIRNELKPNKNKKAENRYKDSSAVDHNRLTYNLLAIMSSAI